MQFGETRHDVGTRTLSTRHLAYLYRTLWVLGVLAAVWAIVLWLTGGFHFEFGGLRLSSRRPRNAVVISVLCIIVAGLLTLLPDGRNAFRDEWTHWRRWYTSTGIWRTRGRHVLRVAVSAYTVAAAAIIIDFYQWRAALPLWVDEEMIALNVRDRSIGDLAGSLWLGQSAPFGWLVLERIALGLLGTAETALRAVPLLFGVATIAVAAWAGRRWMGRLGTVVFVLMCWIGPLLSHYRFEAKHYTADIFFALLLPALSVWTLDTGQRTDRERRVWIWWMVAAVGHWFANGALLVTPACAIILAAFVWRRDGQRAAAWFTIGGLMWLASFWVHYVISIRHTLSNTYLQSMWATELLPPAIGITGSLRWFFDRLEPLALNPGGTVLTAILWMSAIGGFAFAIKRSLGVVLAAVTFSAFAFATVVPLYERFSIWIVPALYLGVALLIDRAFRVASHAVRDRRWMLLAIAIFVLLVQYRLVSDILSRGKVDYDARRGSIYKHQLDDRAAIRWLMSHRQPDDALLTTRLALPAVWWYGNISISDEAESGSVLPDGGAVYEVGPAATCPAQLRDALKDRPRVLLYLGFDVMPGFDHLLLSNLAQLGGMTAHREFGELGRAAVIDLRVPASSSLLQLTRTASAEPVASGECVNVKRAERW